MNLYFLIEEVIIVGKNCRHVVGFETAGVDPSFLLRLFAVLSALTIG